MSRVVIRAPKGKTIRGLAVRDADRRGRISFGRAVLPRAYEATVGLLCRRPDANGSIVDNPRLPQRPGRLCATREHPVRDSRP